MGCNARKTNKQTLYLEKLSILRLLLVVDERIYVWSADRRNAKFSKVKCSIDTLQIISSTWTSLTSDSGLRAHNPTTNTYGVSGRVSDQVILVLSNDSVSTTQTVYSQIVILYDVLEVSYLIISFSAECWDDYRIVS
jgi:hypothetical protein